MGKMTMKASKVALYTVFLTLAVAASAYEPNVVHREMTRRAFDSARAKRDFLKPQLGVDPQVDPTLVSALREKIAQGANDADSSLPIGPLSHFFDPFNDFGLRQRFPFTCVYIPIGPSADGWGTDDLFLNRFDIHDAKDHYLESVTLPTPGQRLESLDKLFNNLGHVVHLVEDMAQPEHTRNDQHLWKEQALGTPVFDREASIYEKVTKQAFETPAVVGLNLTPDQVKSQFLDGYLVVALPSYRSYFHTAGQQGLADYANRNFVTQDTNFNPWDRQCPEEQYPSPTLDSAVPSFKQRSETVRPPPTYNPVVTSVGFDVLKSDISDPNGGPADRERILTMHSLLDFESLLYDVRDSQNQPVRFYSLADDAFLDRAELLMKRAVGYSAGLIDHFFRGRISARWTRGATDYDFTIRITNETPETIRDATLKIYVRLQRPNDPDVLGEVFEMPLADLGRSGTAEASRDLSVTLAGPALLPGERILEFERRIVITGKLGDEEDAVISLVQPPERDRMLIMTNRPFPQPATLDRVALQGSGGIETLMSLPGGWSALGTDPNASHIGTVSPDGGHIALRSTGPFDFITVFHGIPPTSSQRLNPVTADGKRVFIEGRPAWDAASRRLAVYAIKLECGGEQSCGGTFDRKYGIARIDAFSSIVDFREFSDITDQTRNQRNLLNEAIWSRDGRFVDIVGPADQSGPPRIHRFDLFTGQLTTVVPPSRMFGGFDTSSDGTKTYFIGGPSFHLLEYDWITGTERVLFIPPAGSGVIDLELSPLGDRLAFTLRSISSTRAWIYDLASGTTTPAQPQISSGIFGFLRWLPD